MTYGFLIDITKCIGCGLCEEACREKHNFPEIDDQKLSAYKWNVVKTKQVDDEEYYLRQFCMHCQTPTCASVCPVGAIEKTKEGPVIYNPDACIGCRYCIMACPFSVPKYQWDKPLPLMQKCDMCYDRIQKGQQPACAEACPTGATLFGKRDELIQIARDRIRKNPDQYYHYIYGLREAGGTSVLYLSPVAFEKLGFRTKAYQTAFPLFTWKVMKEIPNVVSFSGVFLYGLWWIINRRIKLEKIRAEEEEQKQKEEQK